MARFMQFPWARNGDKVEVPMDPQPSGAVSYSQGFGPDYELNLTTDPQAKRVPRDGTNAYLYDLTDNIRFFQLYGFAPWFAATSNGGNPIAYPINAWVAHQGKVYLSTVANNTREPGTTNSGWREVAPVGQATESVAGITRMATDDEARAQLARDRALCPANLRTLSAASGGPTNLVLHRGNGSWIVPENITVIKATAIGGGGGGSGLFRGDVVCAGGGGGAGGMASGYFGVAPGQKLNWVIGAGGTVNNAGGLTRFWREGENDWLHGGGGLSSWDGALGSTAGGQGGGGGGGAYQTGLGSGQSGWFNSRDGYAMGGSGGGPGARCGADAPGVGGGGAGACNGAYNIGATNGGNGGLILEW